ncbi:hypothetical protein HJFPF1_00661 [Paramyrothecium foliicola]|nr:hypothetical protein HJFPF1_00661 [Paramyrothecium foliicola]
MLQADPGKARGGPYEVAEGPWLQVRRMRPAELARTEDRTPLRQEKPSRRESRLGLRNLFGRSKSIAKQTERPVSPPSTPPSIRYPSTRSQAPERDSRFPETNTPQPQEQSLAVHPHPHPHPPRPLSYAIDPPPSERPPSHSGLPLNEPYSTAPRPARHARNNSDVTSQQPPLFKAYPQAIRNATLQAPTLTADAIIRLSESKGGFNYSDDSPTELLQDTPKEGDKDKDKSRRLQRHVPSLSSSSSTTVPKFEWTNRIYILSTSGCLLEYAGSGSFDRLPEKVVRLSKTSAAFVSDAIPGRLYVLQVSSGIEQEGASTTDTRSLLSKLVPRGSDRRNAANILMTFDNVEDMNGWMVSLRREIEKLGGRRVLSETGEPKKDTESYPQEEESAQRLFVLRDPNRYSRSFSESFDWPGVRDSQGSDGPTPMTRDPSMDDGSTNSVVSQDGRQLDNLRDSGNRLSYISSGQRTMVSSGSSPMSSPTRDSFSPPYDEPQQNYEVRARPNAAAILHRRKSLQTMSPFVEQGTQQTDPSANATPRAVPAMPAVLPRPTPNFSVPRSANRHFPPTRAPQANNESLQNHERDASRRSRPRKPPPMSLLSTRPLSMVVDHPSPQTEIPSRPAMPAMAITHPSPDAGVTLRSARSISGGRSTHLPVAEPWQQASSDMLTGQSGPRRMASMSAIRRPGEGLHRIRTSVVPQSSQLNGGFPEEYAPPSARSLQRASMHACNFTPRPVEVRPHEWIIVSTTSSRTATHHTTTSTATSHERFSTAERGCEG